MEKEEKAFRKAVLVQKAAQLEKSDAVCGSCVHYYKVKNGGMFTPFCKLTTDIQLRQKQPVLQELPEDQQILYRSMADPVAWAAVNLRVFNRENNTWQPWVPRWYQIGTLRCSSKLSCLRMGRQTGKALSLDTPVLTPSGLKPLGALKVGDTIFGQDGKKTKINYMTQTMYNHRVYEIEFNNGDKIKADADHKWKIIDPASKHYDSYTEKVVTTEEMIDIQDRLGSWSKPARVAIKSTECIDFDKEDLPIHPYLLGLWLGDGSRGSGSITCSKQDYIFYKSKLESLGYSVGPLYVGSGEQNCGSFVTYGLISLIKKAGLYKNKHIPENYIFNSKQNRIALLQGLMDSDGTCSKEKGSCEFSQSDLSFAKSFHLLVSTLGIKPNKIRPKPTYRKTSYRISFVSNSIDVFSIPRKLQIQSSFSHEHLKNFKHYVRKITPMPSEPVRCLQVDNKDHMFLIGDTLIPTHNTETLCVSMLHAALTNKHYRVVLVCPNKVQVGEIFRRMRLYLQESPTIMPAVRDIKNPELLEFENGSTIQGFQVGGESGTGDQLRGQSPNKVYVDEVDTLSDEAFDSLTPYLNAHKDTTLTVSSTPRKFGGRFYQICMDKQLGYKEFKFPSSVSPSWSKEMEYYYRRLNPKNVYMQEYEAEFADVSAGVFRKVDIDASLSEYELSDRAPKRGVTYTMGVDWNGDGIGTVICIMGWHQDINKLVLEHIETIDRAGMTQTAAVSRIVDLNETWRPAAIYVDAGFGGMQIEQLRLHGARHPSSGLYDKVSAITMHSKVMITDPSSGMIIDKHAKEFIIDIASRELEESRVILPKSEDNYEGEYGLVGQLRNFKIDKFTETGHRKFSDGKDHAIIAWALSITSMALELPDSPLSTGMNSQIKMKLSGNPSPYRPEDGKEEMTPTFDEIARGIDQKTQREKDRARTQPVDRENITSSSKDDLPIKGQSVNIYDLSRDAGILKKRTAPPKRKSW